MSDPSRPQNRLAAESSPYLLQHAGNPVDWYPWGEEALARAREEEKPIFLSVGYSSCHWCHVMERESFENPEIARFLNERFVSIKVDREERPDLDDVYMKAVQVQTGTGGWPMSVFLLPDLRPFYGGTYFPPHDRWGRPGFLSVLHSLDRLFRERREELEKNAAEVTRHVARMAAGGAAQDEVDERLVERAVSALAGQFDSADGGFGGAPKFPHPMDLELLLLRHAREGRDDLLHMAAFTLEKMARGGMYDQVGGGFHRYSTDDRWVIPHFEKMLYDNALLAPVYADAAAVTGSPLLARVARETCDYVLREMTDPRGGFFSATDADSEGEEGKFFVWTREELDARLGRDASAGFARFFGVEEGGNFEGGTSALVQVGPEEERASFRGALETLRAARAERPPPLLDDKVLTEWNGLMISGLVRAGRRLGEPRYVAAAERAATFLLDEMVDGDRLLRTWRGGDARIDAFLPDHANLVAALLDLAGASASPRWLDEALRLHAAAVRRFAADDGGFYLTADDQEAPLGRSRDPFDNAVPSGNSVMALNLLRVAELTGDPEAHELALGTVRSFTGLMRQAPMGFGRMLQAVDRLARPTPTVVVVGAPAGPEVAALLDVLARSDRPCDVVLTDGARAAAADAPAILRERPAVDGHATAYVCAGGTCQAPVTDAAALEAAVARVGGG